MLMFPFGDEVIMDTYTWERYKQNRWFDHVLGKGVEINVELDWDWDNILLNCEIGFRLKKTNG